MSFDEPVEMRTRIGLEPIARVTSQRNRKLQPGGANELIGGSVLIEARLASTGLLAKVSAQRNPAAHLAAANACESFCAAAYPDRLAAACERQSHHLRKQLLFELLTDIVSRQAICTRRGFSTYSLE